MPCDRNLASVRWHRLVTCRLEERERLCPGLGSLSGAFWDGRAERYAASSKVTDTAGDPLLRRLRRVAGPSSTVIDVGAGTGRFALPLAAGVKELRRLTPARRCSTSSDAMLAAWG